MSDASIYFGQTTQIPVVNAFGNVFSESQIATSGQTIFNIVSFQYTPGTKTLLVFRNGLLKRVGVDYVETDADTVTFSPGVTLNDVITFYAFATQGVATPNGGGVPAGGNAGQVLSKIDSSDYNAAWTTPQNNVFLLSGQCRLVKSGLNIALFRYDGKFVPINGVNEVIPQFGVNLSPAGLTPGTNYYIYVAMVSGTMTLEASTTSHTTDVTTGIETKLGDSSRSLVGLVNVVSGPAFVDIDVQRLVISWYNRKQIKLFNQTTFTYNFSNTGVLVELTPNTRVEYVTWGDVVQGNVCGTITNSVAGQNSYVGMSYDGVGTGTGVTSVASQLGTNNTPFSHNKNVTQSEGYHNANMYVAVSGVSTGSIITNSSVNVTISG